MTRSEKREHETSISKYFSLKLGFDNDHRKDTGNNGTLLLAQLTQSTYLQCGITRVLFMEKSVIQIWNYDLLFLLTKTFKFWNITTGAPSLGDITNFLVRIIMNKMITVSYVWATCKQSLLVLKAPWLYFNVSIQMRTVQNIPQEGSKKIDSS